MRTSPKEVTIGYVYHMGIHIAICHYPIDSIEAIKAISTNDVILYDTPVSSSQEISIDKPIAFGGSRAEGGGVGDVDLEFGEPTQTANAYLVSQLGATIPAFRGVVCAVLKQVYLSAITENIKPWAFKIQWLDSNACGPNLEDMNPAHILQLALTEKWGLNRDASELNLASFTTAKTQLSTEELGLSLTWMSNRPIQDLIANVLQHIMGALYTDPETGQYTLKLMRNGDASALTLDETNVVSLTNYTRPTYSELINEVIVHYYDRDDKEQVITLHNPGLIAQMGGIINSRDLHYDMVAEVETAQKLAARDLRNLSTPLAAVELVANRQAADLRIGDVFTLNWDRYNITAEDFRVMWIDYGTLQDGHVRIQGIQDIYGVDTSLYADPPATQWTDPVSAPAASPYRHLFEMPYYLLARRYGESDTFWDEVPVDAGWVAIAAQKPSSDAQGYQLWTKGSAYAEVDQPDFAPIGTLAADIDPEVTTSTTYTDVHDTEDIIAGTFCIIGTEWCEVTAIDSDAGTISLKRGILDTVPQAHSTGDRIYFAQSYLGEDPEEYGSADTVYAKCLTVTQSGVLAIGSAAEDSVVLDDRYYRPYPPGKFELNSSAYPAYIVGALTITWAHRDRLQQTAGYTAQDAASIGPEAGTTYTVKIWDEEDDLIVNSTGISGTSYALTIANEITLSALAAGARPNESMRVVVYSVRDTMDSWQEHDFEILECEGYGMFYGDYYGE